MSTSSPRLTSHIHILTFFFALAIPFRSKLNKNTENKDFSMTTPLKGDGSDFPCKGYQKDVGTPAGTSTATWAPGSAQKLGITGGAAHNGGSCQLSLSYDGGKTFKVIKSIEGGCVNPAGGDQSFDFTVPADAKGGDAVFAWSWFNNTGNREMYMNCAPVTISGSGTNDLAGNPDMFVANVGAAGGGCGTTETSDVQFPNPGKDVLVSPGAKLAPPTNCAAASAPAPKAGGDTPAPQAAGSSAPAPPASSGAPPASSGAPPASSGAPPASSGAPPASSGSPPASSGAPPASTGAPPAPGAPKEAPAPAGGSGSYTVKTGDVCSTIATQNGMTVADLIKKNPTMYVFCFIPFPRLKLTCLSSLSDAGCTNLAVGQKITLRRRSRIMRDIN